MDVSFNLGTRGDVQGTPPVEMTTDDLLRAVTTGLQANFVTARAAARQMVAQGSGVGLHLNSASGAGAMLGMGSTGPSGVRVVGLWTACVYETLTHKKIEDVSGAVGPQVDAAREMIAGMAALRRADIAETAAFVASDRAAGPTGTTGTTVNVTCGLVLR